MKPLRSPNSAAWAAIVATVALLAAGVSLGADGEPSGSSASEVLVEALDGGGRPVNELTPGDLVARIDGRPASVVSVDRIEEPWRLILLLDLERAPASAARNVAAVLSERARDLVEKGSVEVVLFDDEIRESMPATRDPLILGQNLSWLSLRAEGRDAQILLREEFLREHRLDGEIESPYPDPLSLAAAAGDAMTREADLLTRHEEELVSWLAATDSGAPTALIWVSGGFDAEPAMFYGAVMSRVGLLAEGDTPTPVEVRTSIDRFAETVAAFGWVVLPYVPPARSRSALLDYSGPLDEEEIESQRILGRDVPTDLSDPTEERTATGIDLLDLGRDREAIESREPDGSQIPLLIEPLAPFQVVASATGGVVVTDERQLTSALDRLAERFRVELSWPEPTSGGAGPGRVAALSVESNRPNVSLRAPGWLGSGTPALVGETRARRFLAGDLSAEVDIPVGAAIRGGGQGLQGGDLIVQLDGSIVSSGPLRATVVMDWGGADLSVYQRQLASEPQSAGVSWTAGEDEGDRYYYLPAPAPTRPENRVVVVVEDLSTGKWGGAYASYLDAAVGAVDDEPYLLPAPQVVHLLAPPDVLAVGSTELRAIISTEDVRRIDFVLDGELVASRTAPPFAVTVDLGNLPRTREIEAIAYDADGDEIGSDLMVLNEGAGSLRVRITRPQPEDLRGRSGPITGSLEVETEVKAPRFAPVERVEFFWNTSLVATSYGPPYRQRIRIPEDAPQGFVRVVAHLDDGTTGEDVLFVNTIGSTERLDVNLVELFLVVVDREGRPVRDLEQGPFRVFEEGDEQTIAAFSDAGGQPLTVGLAIDASASMFVKLPQVQQAAADFVVGSLEERDRAFVVGFSDEPDLVQDTTSEPNKLVRAIGELRPEGHTAVWKAIVYSLVQLQGVPGRKALIVYSDGADEDEEFSYRTCLRFARRLGVPIYMIVANNEIYRTGGKNLAVKSSYNRLLKLADAVGGKVFVTHVGADLEAIYSEISTELRSQYMLAYYPEERGADEWRRVKVELDIPGLEARTVAGYFR